MRLWLKAEDSGLVGVRIGNLDPGLLEGLLPETDGAEIVALKRIGFPDEKSVQREGTQR